MRKFEPKILSFSTTMRNPARIPLFLKAIKPFENEILTSEIIIKIVKNVINSKLYCPQFITKNRNLKAKFESDEEFTDDELNEIIKNSTQNHKEKGFEKGWESRFDTWYKFIKELGFCYYQKNKKIEISEPGKILINSIKNDETSDEAISNIFLNAMSKYQVGNPFKKNSNLTTPFILLLKLIEKLHKFDDSSAGIFRDEISILLCYPNNNVDELFNYIINLRKEIYKISKVKFGYSDEFIYEKCLNLLKTKNEKRFKISQITGEAVDEYIRKMRITGLISLRGNGNFLDFNKNEMSKIKYLLSKNIQEHSEFLDDSYEKQYEFYLYMSEIDTILLNKKPAFDSSNIKISKLYEFANSYNKEFIEQELLITCSKKHDSKNNILKLIDKPLRFEFLTAIFLKQVFKESEISSNYICDDEGIPIRFAGGNKADILATDEKTQSFVEVSLMQGRIQVANEMIPIQRHLIQNLKDKTIKKEKFSLFIAPSIHEDVIKFSQFSEYTDKANISCYDIKSFIKKANNSSEILDLKINYLG